jgi:transcriptional regulator with XRE-family HTH domain
MPTRYTQEGMDRVMRQIRKTRGLSVKVAQACGVSRAAVYQWRRVPPAWVQTVAPIVGLTPEEIRPDIFKPRRAKQQKGLAHGKAS